MRSAELDRIVETLLRGTKRGDVISLDAVGEATGSLAITTAEIDVILAAIEKQGRRVSSPAGGDGEAHLKLVIEAARSLRSELGRPPKPEEIAERCGLEVAAVRHALKLATIMQR